jgi:hypothetical protein
MLAHAFLAVAARARRPRAGPARTAGQPGRSGRAR